MPTIEQLALSREGRKEIVMFCNGWKWHMPDAEMREGCSGDIYDRVRELPQEIRQFAFTDYESVKSRIEDYIQREEMCLVNCVEPSVPPTDTTAIVRRAVVIAKYKPQQTSDLENKRKKIVFAIALRDLLRNYC